MKRGYLVFNPSAGMRAKTAIRVQEVIRLFAAESIEMVPSPTQADGSVILQVREMIQEKPDLIVTWGGDGTINEVVNGMFGTGIPLGFLPGGTANLMVRELGIPQNVPKAIQLIGTGNSRLISVGQANDRYFLLMVGVGFDSAVIQNVNLSIKRKFGKLAFGISAIHTAVNYRFPQFHVQFDGQNTDCVFAVICNARHYAAYFVLTPDADISDDYLYLCLFQDPGLARLFQYAFHALRRTHIQLPSVKVIRAKELLVTGAEGVAVQADGELAGSLPIQFSIHPRSLQVFCPK
ncbi:diacylglycerol kinase family lipid kinase [bacterium]|nr:diacylglycerol kinase family lipid kinase [bacterium]